VQESKQQQGLPNISRTINKLRDNIHDATENNLQLNIDKKEGRGVLKTHNYFASNFTSKEPNHFAFHQNKEVLDGSKSQNGVVEIFKTIESILKSLKIWV
jgi:hypothetical protein